MVCIFVDDVHFEDPTNFKLQLGTSTAIPVVSSYINNSNPKHHRYNFYRAEVASSRVRAYIQKQNDNDQKQSNAGAYKLHGPHSI